MQKESFTLFPSEYTVIDLIDLINRNCQNNQKSIET